MRSDLRMVRMVQGDLNAKVISTLGFGTNVEVKTGWEDREVYFFALMIDNFFIA